MRKILVQLVSVVALVFFAAACGSDQTTRAADGEIVEGGDLGVFAVKEGDCVNVPDGEELSEFEGVACTEPHDAQVSALFDLTEAAFPGQASATELGNEGCMERFEPFMGVAYEDSAYYFYPVTPTQQSWDQVDDREVICLIVSGDNSKLTTDLRGSAS